MAVKNYLVEFHITQMVSVDTEKEPEINIAEKAFEQMDIENNIEVISINEVN